MSQIVSFFGSGTDPTSLCPSSVQRGSDPQCVVFDPGVSCVSTVVFTVDVLSTPHYSNPKNRREFRVELNISSIRGAVPSLVHLH